VGRCQRQEEQPVALTGMAVGRVAAVGTVARPVSLDHQTPTLLRWIRPFLMRVRPCHYPHSSRNAPSTSPAPTTADMEHSMGGDFLWTRGTGERYSHCALVKYRGAL